MPTCRIRVCQARRILKNSFSSTRYASTATNSPPPSKLLLAGQQLLLRPHDKWPALVKNVKFEPVQEALRRLQDSYDTLASLRDMAESETDPDMRAMATQDIQTASEELPEMEASVQSLLFPPSSSDTLSALVEVKAGVGGDEAALFTGDMVRLYTRMAQRKKWRVDLIEHTPATVSVSLTASQKAYKHALLEITGHGAYGRLRHEIGVHRVQRVPSTESAGRIHSSTASVIVFPVVPERVAEDPLNEKDVKIEVMRAGGAGGQHVNKTESAVRLTHLPTGITVSMQDSRSQAQNRQKAFTVLRSRLLDHQLLREQAERKASRRSQVKSMDRSERIRSYSSSQMRVTDHRIPATTTNVSVDQLVENPDVLDEFSEVLEEREGAEKLEALIEELGSEGR